MSFSATYPNCPIAPRLNGATRPSWTSSAARTSDPVWVKLRHLPSAFSFDEAMLLTQESPEIWIAWVPEHGEIQLHRQDFSFE